MGTSILSIHQQITCLSNYQYNLQKYNWCNPVKYTAPTTGTFILNCSVGKEEINKELIAIYIITISSCNLKTCFKSERTPTKFMHETKI